MHANVNAVIASAKGELPCHSLALNIHIYSELSKGIDKAFVISKWQL